MICLLVVSTGCFHRAFAYVFDCLIQIGVLSNLFCVLVMFGTLADSFVLDLFSPEIAGKYFGNLGPSCLDLTRISSHWQLYYCLLCSFFNSVYFFFIFFALFFKLPWNKLCVHIIMLWFSWPKRNVCEVHRLTTRVKVRDLTTVILLFLLCSRCLFFRFIYLFPSSLSLPPSPPLSLFLSLSFPSLSSPPLSFSLSLSVCLSVSPLSLFLSLRPLSISVSHSGHRFPAPSSKGRKDVVNQCLEFVSVPVCLSVCLPPISLSESWPVKEELSSGALYKMTLYYSLWFYFY